MSALDTQVAGSHYKDCAIQPAVFIEANKLQFLEGCVVKRLCRHDKPTGKGRQDIEKAIHELQLLLELRYGESQAQERLVIGQRVRQAGPLESIGVGTIMESFPSGTFDVMWDGLSRPVRHNAAELVPA